MLKASINTLYSWEHSKETHREYRAATPCTWCVAGVEAAHDPRGPQGLLQPCPGEGRAGSKFGAPEPPVFITGRCGTEEVPESGGWGGWEGRSKWWCPLLVHSQQHLTLGLLSANGCILWYTFSIIVQCTIIHLALLETVVFTPALLGKGLYSTWTVLPGGRF
jgi:hypothetical protein